MLRHLLAAFVGMLLIVPVFADETMDEAPIVTHEFELNKRFSDVSLAMLREGNFIREKMKMEVVKQDVNSGTLILSRDGWIFILDQKIVVNVRPGGEVNLVESVQVKKDSITIEDRLDGDDDYFDTFRATIEIVKNGDKTLVRTNFWVCLKQGNRLIVVRTMVRRNAKHLEEAMREVVGDWLPKETK